MLIHPINTVSKENPRSNQIFKSAYPVIHWIAETNGSYAPVISENLAKKLQKKLLKCLNYDFLCKAKTQMWAKAFEAYKYVYNKDKDFASHPIARSFYNRNGGKFINNKFESTSYLITGADLISFENSLTKPIGRLKKESPMIKGKAISAELNMALGDYWNRGLNFVKNKSKEFCDEKGIPQELHTKFKVIRTKTGKIKNFELVGMKFLPSKGSENPFERLGMITPSK
jgi:hypothetical protein